MCEREGDHITSQDDGRHRCILTEFHIRRWWKPLLRFAPGDDQHQQDGEHQRSHHRHRPSVAISPCPAQLQRHPRIPFNLSRRSTRPMRCGASSRVYGAMPPRVLPVRTPHVLPNFRPATINATQSTPTTYAMEHTAYPERSTMPKLLILKHLRNLLPRACTARCRAGHLPPMTGEKFSCVRLSELS